jgi:hypothetical protein
VTGLDLRPVGMEEELDKATKRWFDLLWNGSYRCGFATSQVAYDEVRHASSRSTYNVIILKIAVINSLLSGSKGCSEGIGGNERTPCIEALSYW